MLTVLFRPDLDVYIIAPPFWEISELVQGNREMCYEIAENIIMFIPFGVLLPVCFRKADKMGIIALTALLFSFIIEIAQLVTARGFFEFDDMLNNTIGAVIGAFIGCPHAKWLYSDCNSRNEQ